MYNENVYHLFSLKGKKDKNKGGMNMLKANIGWSTQKQMYNKLKPLQLLG